MGSCDDGDEIHRKEREPAEIVVRGHDGKIGVTFPNAGGEASTTILDKSDVYARMALAKQREERGDNGLNNVRRCTQPNCPCRTILKCVRSLSKRLDIDHQPARSRQEVVTGRC